jgi:trigger factor
MSEVLRGKALASLVESATVKDASGNELELSRLRADGTIATDDELAAEKAAAEAAQVEAAAGAAVQVADDAADVAADTDTDEPAADEEPKDN